MFRVIGRMLSRALLILWDAFSFVAAFYLSAFAITYTEYIYLHDVSFFNPSDWLITDPELANELYFIPQLVSDPTWLPTFLIVCASVYVLINALFGNYTSVLKHYGLGEVSRTLGACLVFGGGFFLLNIVHTMEFLGPWLESTPWLNDFFNNVINIYPSIEWMYFLVNTAFLIIFSLIARSSVRFIKEVYARIHAFSRKYRGDSVRTLIFGAGEAGAYFCAKLKKDLYTNLSPVVFIDDDKSLQGTRVHGIKVYGGSEKLLEAIEKYDIDEVVVAIPTASRQVLKYVVDICRKQKCKIRRFGKIDDVDLSNVKLTNINLVDLLRRDNVDLNMEVVEEFVKGKVVLVTGGAGSIGSEICRQVLSFGCSHLVIFDIHENGLFDIENELRKDYDGKFSLRLGSVRDEVRLKEVFDEFSPKLVFHAAAHKHVPMMEYSPKEAIKNNVRGTINVAKRSIIEKVEKFILISTDKAVNPTNIMGASKRIAEQAIQLLDTMSDTDLSAVRFGNVLGSNGSVVPVFRKQIEQGGPVTVTHPDMRRYFMTIPEAVQLVLEAGAMANGGEIFVLNMGEPVKIYDLACDLIRLSGLEPGVDINIKFTGLRPGEKLFEEISMSDEDVTKTDNEKIFIMKPMEFDSELFSNSLKDLERSSLEDDPKDMFKIVKKLVPTFKHD